MSQLSNRKPKSVASSVNASFTLNSARKIVETTKITNIDENGRQVGNFSIRGANSHEEDTFNIICSYYTQQQAAKVVSNLEIVLSARHGSQRLEAMKG